MHFNILFCLVFKSKTHRPVTFGGRVMGSGTKLLIEMGITTITTVISNDQTGGGSCESFGFGVGYVASTSVNQKTSDSALRLNIEELS